MNTISNPIFARFWVSKCIYIALLVLLSYRLNAGVTNDSMLVRLQQMQEEWKCISRFCFYTLINSKQPARESLLVSDSSFSFAILPCAITDSFRVVRMSGLWTFDYTSDNVRVGHVKLQNDTLTVFDFGPHLLLRKFIRTDFDEKLFTQLRKGYFCMECLDGAWEPDADSLQSGSVQMKTKMGFNGSTWISIPSEYYSLWISKTRLPFGKRTRMYRTKLVADFNRSKWLLKITPVRGRFRKQTFIYTRNM